MGLPGKCWYPAQAFRSGGPQALAQVMEDFFRSGWDPLVLGGVDGSNAHPNLAGGGLSWSGSSGSGGGGPYPPKPNPPPHLPTPWAKRLVVELADETADARIQKKGAPGTPEKKKPGIEFVIDTTDTTYGKACFVAKQDLSKQIGSVILENPVTVTNPKFSVLANYGKQVLGTSAAHNWELHRNGAVSLDDDGSRVKNYRSSLYLGGDDLSVERGAAGKMLLKDPSGGNTLPSISFHLNGSPTTPMMRRNGATLEVKLSDNSDFADFSSADQFYKSGSNTYAWVTNSGLYRAVSTGGVRWASSATDAGSGDDTGLGRASAGVVKSTDGSTGFGDHALSDLLGYGAATGFRTKIDFGTPTADRTLTAPNRDLTLVGRAAALTNGQLVKADANGDIVDVGNAAAARTLIGAGTIATQDASSVALTGGTIDAVSIRDFRKGYVTFTASAAGNNNVNSTTATAFVNAFAIGTTDNYDVTLPDATTCGGRVINVKIIEPGSGSATVTVKSAGGGLDQVAAATGVPMDATAFSKVAYQSDGTNWWSV